MDTGTSIMLLTDDIVVPYYAKVQGAVNSTLGYVFPCSSPLPSFTLRIGTGGYFTVPGKYLNFGPASSASTTILKRGSNASDEEQCYGALQSSNSAGEDGLNILGDVFIKAVYVVFDMSGPQVGVAQKRRSWW